MVSECFNEILANRSTKSGVCVQWDSRFPCGSYLRRPSDIMPKEFQTAYETKTIRYDLVLISLLQTFVL